MSKANRHLILFMGLLDSMCISLGLHNTIQTLVFLKLSEFRSKVLVIMFVEH